MTKDLKHVLFEALIRGWYLMRWVSYRNKTMDNGGRQSSRGHSHGTRPYLCNTWLTPDVNKMSMRHEMLLQLLGCLITWHKCLRLLITLFNCCTVMNYVFEQKKERKKEEWETDKHRRSARRGDRLSDKCSQRGVVIIISENWNCLFIISWKRLDVWMSEVFHQRTVK